MNESFFTPISIQPFSGSFFNNTGKENKTGSSMFRDVFQSAIQNVVSSEQDLNEKEYLLATGQIDDAHTVPIATANAQLSVELLVALRTRALESYNEIIRLGV